MQTGQGESEFDRALGLDDAEDEDDGFPGHAHLTSGRRSEPSAGSRQRCITASSRLWPVSSW
jgi:hypothetical protein